MGVTVHSHCVERALQVSYSDVGEGGVAVNCEKTQFFLNTLYVIQYPGGDVTYEVKLRKVCRKK